MEVMVAVSITAGMALMVALSFQTAFKARRGGGAGTRALPPLSSSGCRLVSS